MFLIILGAHPDPCLHSLCCFPLLFGRFFCNTMRQEKSSWYRTRKNNIYCWHSKVYINYTLVALRNCLRFFSAQSTAAVSTMCGRRVFRLDPSSLSTACSYTPRPLYYKLRKIKSYSTTSKIFWSLVCLKMTSRNFSGHVPDNLLYEVRYILKLNVYFNINLTILSLKTVLWSL